MTIRRSSPITAPALALALLMAGCGSEDALVEPAPVSGIPADPAPGDAELASVELSEDEIETIRQLPDDEAELALAQKICPVSDEALGSMGVPIKLDVKGRDVFICCAGCEGAIEDDPDAILAKLPPRE
jgi:hypothetical protein